MDLLRDYIISFWYRNVVNFSAQKQTALLRDLWKDLKNAEVKDLLKPLRAALLLLISLCILWGAAVLYLRQFRKTPENLYFKLIKKLERLEGKQLRKVLPEEVMRMTRSKPYATEVEFIVNLYRKKRFSSHRVSPAEVEKGYRLLRKIQ